MQIEKFSEIIAHFIGIFETTTEEMRLRAELTEGTGPAENDPALDDLVNSTPAFASDLMLKDYDPDVDYRSVSYDILYGSPHRFGRPFEESLEKLSEIAHRDVPLPRFGSPQDIDVEAEEKLEVFNGPGSASGYATQINMLDDGDFLDMTNGHHASRDTSFVTERLAEFSADAEIFTPFASLQRTDTFEGVKQTADEMEAYIRAVKDSGRASIGTTEPPADNPNNQAHDFVLAGDEISGTYMNSKLVSEVSALNDLLPDRDLAKPPEDPDESQASVEQHDPASNSLEVTAGANLLANIASVVTTAVISPVTAVMGDHHQIDAITQVYVYSDNDDIASVFHSSADGAESAGVSAYNIASFERSTFQHDQSLTIVDAQGDPIFPTAWRVSVIDGDISFVNWVEQYHFVSDNDTMIVTTSGSETTVLTGGNTTLNFSSFFQMSSQYDLVIVGGSVYDINSITQISLLYDNDWARAEDGVDGNATIQSGNNLIWNFAAIHNVGAADRFETMPDYMHEAEKGIQERDPTMPEGLSNDLNFQGYIGLNVLYITGNLFDMTIIKQVAVLGDSDDVTQAAAELLKDNRDAVVTIDTGSNTIANIAEIIDYDSFGSTTYVAGQLYSDAILIQGGIIEHDTTQPEMAGQKLANEVIAFLNDDDAHDSADSGDGIINGGHDLSWSSAHPSDVMQAVVA
ncbi:hypothetical protein FHT78_003129 [Rhizobium sp. BK196]|uniref:hypothetical protein n=1 Tax=Rhizobium sp. BK196 TaxID=2587073 RepID=UPI001608E8EC|nr:hypothetical protein [Rhizobium sp. BK196]MBB3311364.1 hypothetical protein [Rhizobium sp. BK196]